MSDIFKNYVSLDELRKNQGYSNAFGGSSPSYTNSAQFNAFWDVHNVFGSYYANQESDYVDPNWNLASYLREQKDLTDEERLDLFKLGHNTRSEAQFMDRVENLRKNALDRQIIESAGTLESLAYGAFAAIADPITIGSIFIGTPYLTIGGKALQTGARVGAAAAVETGLQEGILRYQQGQTRPLSESALNMAGGFILGGVLGTASGAMTRAAVKRNETLVANTLKEASEINVTRTYTYDGAQKVMLVGELDPVKIRESSNQIEGHSTARKFLLHRMTDGLSGALAQSPAARTLMGHIVSLDGLTAANLTGRATSPVAPASNAIDAFQGEFTRRMYDFQITSFKSYADHMDASKMKTMIDQGINVTMLERHNQRLGELMLIYDGTEASLKNVHLRGVGEKGDFSWAKGALDELDDILEQYQFKLFTHGGFNRELNRHVFGAGSGGGVRDIDWARNEIVSIDEKISEAAEVLSRGEEELKSAAVRDLERQVEKGEKQKAAILKDAVREARRNAKRSAKKAEEDLKRAVDAKEIALAKFDNESAQIFKEIGSGKKRIQTRRGADGKPNTREVEIQRRRMERKDQRKKLESSLNKKIQKAKDDGRKEIESIKKSLADTNAKAERQARQNLEGIEKKLGRQVNSIKSKAEKTQAALQTKRAEIEQQIALMEKINSGDYKAAKSIMDEFHGERRYRPQVMSKGAMRRAGFDKWFDDFAAARISWMQRQLNLGRGTDAQKLLWEKDIQSLSNPSTKTIQQHRELYEHLIDEMTVANDFWSKSTSSQLRRESSRLKSRQFNYDQSLMSHYMENDIQKLMGQHMATVIPEAELRARGLWDEEDLSEMFREVSKEYTALKDEIFEDPTITEKKRGKRIKQLEREEERVKTAVKNTLRQLRNEEYGEFPDWHKEVVYWVNAINGMRTLGGVLPTSLPDATMAIGKVGGKHMGRALDAFKKEFEEVTKGLTKEEIGKVYGIFEYGSFSTISKLIGSDDYGLNPSRASQYLGAVQSGFYKATGIIKWNQVMKEMVSFGAMDKVLEGAINPSALSDMDLAWLARDGFNRERLDQVAELFRTKGFGVELEGGLKVLDIAAIRRAAMENKEFMPAMRLADDLAASMNRAANRAVVTPGAGDMPGFIVGNPYTKLVMSLKTFGLASINKTTLPLAGGLKNGDHGMAAWAIASIFVGTGSYMLRQKIYDREISENPQTLFWEGFNRSGMLGIYNQGLTMAQMMTNNFLGVGEAIGLEVPARYYARGVASDLLGPTMGILEGGAEAINTYSKYASGEEISAKEAARVARLIPFNNLFYLRGALERILKDDD